MPQAVAQVPAPASASPAAPAATNPNFITNAVQKVGPAVVRIGSTRTVKTQLPDAFNIFLMG